MKNEDFKMRFQIISENRCKNVETVVANKNLEQAQEALKLACTKLDKALAKGIFIKIS